MRLSAVVAMANNRVIGRRGDIPWNLKDDLKRFQDLTREHVVIAGRKTYESILRRLGHPLFGRKTIVVSRTNTYVASGVVTETSLENALKTAERFAGPRGEVFVIGGAEIYREAWPRINRVYLTRVQTEIPDGDTFFPGFPIDEFEWKIISTEHHAADARNDHDFSFVVVERRQPFVELSNARKDDQREVMKAIAAADECPFCEANLPKYHKKEILFRGDYWLLTESQWPYDNTRHHLLLISRKHVEKITELNPEAWSEILKIMWWAEEKFSLTAGALGIRFGDPKKTGGTVRHLHVHLIEADITDRNDPNYQPVRLRVG